MLGFLIASSLHFSPVRGRSMTYNLSPRKPLESTWKYD